MAFDSDGFLFAGINNRGVLKSVQSTIVATPNLVLPAEGATSVTLTPALTWDPVAIADKYQVQVCLDNTFIGGVIVDVTGISTTSYQITAGTLNGNSTYYWRVRALNSSGSSNWSAVRQFTTIDLPAAPVLVSPSNGASV